MKRLDKEQSKSKKKIMGNPEIVTAEEYSDMGVNSQIELIKELVPLGLMYVNEVLQAEINQLAGRQFARH